MKTKNKEYNNNRKKENKLLITITICVLVLIIILLLIFGIFLPNLNKDTPQNNENIVANNEISIESIYKPSENEWITLQLSGEESRMQYYVATFVNNYVGDEQYQLAYNVLSSGFKQNYFETFEKFEAYAKQTYPVLVALSYGYLQREGELYILDVTIEDLMGEKETFTQTFIIKEHDFNDYELAFSV